jgi:hypothetical protein
MKRAWALVPAVALITGAAAAPSSASTGGYVSASYALIVGSTWPQSPYGYFPVKLVWSAAKPQPPSYLVDMEEQGYSGGETVFTAKTAKTSYVFDPSRYKLSEPGQDGFQFSVTPLYAGGRKGPTSINVAYLSMNTADTSSFQYNGGGWHSAASSNYLSGINEFTTVQGASAVTGFYDGTTNIGIVATQGPKGGLMAVYLAGKKVATVNLYAPVTHDRVLVWANNNGNTNYISLHSRPIKLVNVSTSATRNQINANGLEEIACGGSPICG